MVRIPFWLREPLRRFIQYLGVFVASVPAGIAYIFLLSRVDNTVALIVTLPLGLLCAYFAWSLIGKHFLPDLKKQLHVFSNVETSTDQTVYEPGTVLVGALAVVVFATCVVSATTQVPATVPAVENSADTSVL